MTICIYFQWSFQLGLNYNSDIHLGMWILQPPPQDWHWVSGLRIHLREKESEKQIHTYINAHIRVYIYIYVSIYTRTRQIKNSVYLWEQRGITFIKGLQHQSNVLIFQNILSREGERKRETERQRQRHRDRDREKHF